MKRVFTSLVVFIFSFSLFPQKSKNYFLLDSVDYDSLSPADRSALDSLLPLYHKATHDTMRLKILAIIPELINDENIWPRYNRLLFEKAKIYLQNNTSLNEKEIKAGKKYLGQSYQNFGYQAQFLNGNMKLARFYYDSALVLQVQGEDKKGMAITLQNIGIIYNDQGDIITSLDYFFRSLKMQEEINDKNGMGYSFNNIAGAYLLQGDTAKALEYMEKSIIYRKETGDKRGYAISLANVANLYGRKNQFDVALSYYQKIVELWKELGERQGIGFAYHNIGMLYISKAQNAKNKESDSLYAFAMKNLQDAIRYYETAGFRQGLSMVFASMGNCYLQKNDLTSAERYGIRSYEEANTLGYTEAIRNSSHLLYQIYKKQQKWAKSLKMHEIYIQMRDSILNQETQKSIVKQQMKYEYEKQQALKDAEHKKELVLAEESKKQQRIISYSIAAGLFVVSIFSVFIYTRLKITRRQKQIIEYQKIIVDQKNKHITDSINYAKRIQDAILPTKEEFKKHFTDYFVFFQPKEIVSGDFYWISSHKDKTVFAVADCTGHGVPGAFMSMIGYTLLNEIVNEKNIFQPAEILNHLNESIVRALHQEERTQDDGMDISVCLFEKDNILFAGANHSIFVVQNNVPVEVKGDIYSIGSTFGKQNFRFSQKVYPRNQISHVYFTTDGFPDQIGGPHGKKFLFKKIEELILSILDRPMHEQEEKIRNTFKSWKENYRQLDDVLLVGIKISS